MSIHSVDVPPTDVIGDALRLHLGPNGLDAVALRRVELADGWALVLEVLAASHRVTLESPTGPVLVETVACGAGSDRPAVDPERLPAVHQSDFAAGRYVFSSQRGEGPEATAAAERVRAVGGRSDSLVVEFPGHPDALTGLVVDVSPAAGAASDTVAWSTWHVYPGAAAHVVATSSSFVRSEGGL